MISGQARLKIIPTYNNIKKNQKHSSGGSAMKNCGSLRSEANISTVFHDILEWKKREVGNWSTMAFLLALNLCNLCI